MGENHEPTRKELAAELEAQRTENADLKARMERLEALVAKPPEPVFTQTDLDRLRQAREELEALRPGASRSFAAPTGPAPQLVPYKGLVRATQDCTYGSYRAGPGSTSAACGANADPDGDVFEVDVQALWSDDPWVPVRQVAREGGAVYYVPRTDVPIVDARFRVRLQQAAINDPIARAV